MTDLPLPTARDWMTEQFLTFQPEDPVFEAIDQLLEAAQPAAPVVDEMGRLLGMFTEKDALRALSHLVYNLTAEGATVGNHMSHEFPSCQPGMDLFQVSELFLSCNYPALPVVDGGRLIGLLRRNAQLRCIEEFRLKIDREHSAQERRAGRQADRPRGIGALQRAAAQTTREQLVRLFGRKSN